MSLSKRKFKEKETKETDGREMELYSKWWASKSTNHQILTQKFWTVPNVVCSFLFRPKVTFLEERWLGAGMGRGKLFSSKRAQMA